MKNDVTILVFDDVEVLDFAGPFEVFSVTNELQDYSLFNINIVGKKNAPVIAKNGLSINVDDTIGDTLETDILIIPGGDGTRPVIKDQETIEWIKRLSLGASHVLSVCSGALILAKSGLLDGLQATTHHQALEELAALAPTTTIVDNRYGKEIAKSTEQYMEYRRI